MRNFIFFLLLIPVLASLGHDAYMYYQEPEKGIRLSALGSLWDKYHKESHDQWKSKVIEVNQSVDELIPERIIPKNITEDITKNIESLKGMLPEELTPKKDTQPPEQPATEESVEIVDEEAVKEPPPPPANDFSEGFTQSISRDGKTEVKEYVPENNKDKLAGRTKAIITAIGFLLEQKAVLVLGALPVIFWLLSALFGAIFKEKEEMDTIRSLKKKKRKGGGYQYNRK